MSDFSAFDALMLERFGKDSLIALATESGGLPHIRTIDAVYVDGAFYGITHALSGKMQQIAANPRVAVCGDWFTGHGLGKNLGHILAPENEALANRLRDAFKVWYSNGHTDESDPNTCILMIRLTDGVIFSKGKNANVRTNNASSHLGSTLKWLAASFFWNFGTNAPIQKIHFMR